MITFSCQLGLGDIFTCSLSFFSLQTVINKQWMGIAANDKMEIRNSVNQYLLTNHTAVPTYIRNKLVKLVVDIGRLDWPHFYPDFFPSILQVMWLSQ